MSFELREFNIDVLSVRSMGGIKIAKLDGSGMLGVTAEQCVQASLRKITSDVIYGHWKHEVIGVAASIVMDLMPFETRMAGTAKFYEEA